MGLFGDFFSWVGEKISDAKYWVEDKLDDLAYAIGLKSYGGGSEPGDDEIEKWISDFKRDLEVKATDREKNKITYAMSSLDKLIDVMKAEAHTFQFDIAGALEAKKESTINDLSGTIMDYVNKHFSENDPDFRKIIEKRPSDEKTEKLKNRTNQILQKAERKFDIKLVKSTKELEKIVEERLQSALDDKQASLNEQEKQYKSLLNGIEKGTLQIEELTNEWLPVYNADRCIVAALSTDGAASKM